MRKFLRVSGIVLGCLLGLMLVGYLGLRVYLSTGSAKRMASEQLSAALGGNVRVTELSAGMASTEVQVEVLPQPGPDGKAATEPIVSGKVVADVSPVGLAAGKSPTEVTLSDAKVNLHFDKDGNLTDKLPEPKGGGGGGEVPEIRVKNASVLLKQEGRPDFHISGIDVTVSPSGDRLKITGHANDPNWKAWTLTGDWAKDGSAGTVSLKADAPVPVDPAKLKSVPFVPHETWDWVVLDANTTCDLSLTRGADRKFAYKVVMTPSNGRLTIPPIDVTLTDAAAKRVEVEGAKVTLAGVTGKLAGGEVDVNSVLDFTPEPSELVFDVKARGLNIRDLPKDWGLPELEAGKLQGRAKVKLVVPAKGPVQPWGRGEADIVGGRLFGGTVEGKITMVGDGKRLRFEQQTAAAPRRADDLEVAAALLAALLQAPAQPPATPGQPAKKDSPTYVQANLRLKDVDLAELIKRLNATAPIKITGRASLDVRAEIPVTQARTIRAYRVQGTLTIPELGLEGLTLKQVTAQVDLRDGVLSLTKLSVQVPGDADAKTGVVVGTAKVGVDPKADLTAELKMDSVSLAQVFKAAPGMAGMASGAVSGSLTLRGPADRLSDVTAYVADGKLTAPRLTAVGRKIDGLALTLALRKGVASITDASATIEGLPVSGSAALTLTGEYPFTARVSTSPKEAVSLKRLVPEAGLDATARLAINADAKGTLSPFAVAAGGTAAASDVTMGTTKIPHVAFDWSVDPDQAVVKNIRSDVAGGGIGGAITVPFKGTAAGRIDVTFKDVDAAALAALVPGGLPVKLGGKVSGKVKATLPKGQAGAARETTGSLALSGVSLAGADVSDLSFDWSVGENAVTLKNIHAKLGKGSLAGSVKLPQKETEAGQFNLAFKDLDLGTVLRAVPNANVPLEGPATGKLEGLILPTKPGAPRQANASLDLTSPQLRFQGLPVDRVKGTVDYKPARVDLNLNGEFLGGSLAGTFHIPLNQQQPSGGGGGGAPQGQKQPPPPPEMGGVFRLAGADLGRLADALRVQSLAPLRGTVNALVKFNYDKDGKGPFGSGLIELVNLGWGRSTDSLIQSDIRITPLAVEVPDLSGRFAEGNLRGRVRYVLANPERSFYELHLDGADAGALLAPLGFNALNTRLNLTTQGNIGRRLRGSGVAAFSRGKVTGFELAQVRLPFDWYHTLGRGGQLSVRDAGGQAAGGRVTGEATVAWGYATHAQGRFRFVDLSFRSLLGQFGQSSGLGSGRMNGFFSFSGSNMRSINDLGGELVATLGEGPVFDLPVFSQLAQYAVPTFSARGLVQFTEGELRARLGGGVFRIQQFAMTGPRAKLYMEGSVGLNRRLDLDAVVQTGQLAPDPRALRLLGLRIPMIGPIPVGLILEVTSYLSNRVVRARITGTIDQPIVQVNVAGLLTEGAVRYFLTPYLPYR